MSQVIETDGQDINGRHFYTKQKRGNALRKKKDEEKKERKKAVLPKLLPMTSCDLLDVRCTRLKFDGKLDSVKYVLLRRLPVNFHTVLKNSFTSN